MIIEPTTMSIVENIAKFLDSPLKTDFILNIPVYAII